MASAKEVAFYVKNPDDLQSILNLLYDQAHSSKTVPNSLKTKINKYNQISEEVNSILSAKQEITKNSQRTHYHKITRHNWRKVQQAKPQSLVQAMPTYINKKSHHYRISHHPSQYLEY